MKNVFQHFKKGFVVVGGVCFGGHEYKYKNNINMNLRNQNVAFFTCQHRDVFYGKYKRGWSWRGV